MSWTGATGPAYSRLRTLARSFAERESPRPPRAAGRVLLVAVSMLISTTAEILDLGICCSLLLVSCRLMLVLA